MVTSSKESSHQKEILQSTQAFERRYARINERVSHYFCAAIRGSIDTGMTLAISAGMSRYTVDFHIYWDLQTALLFKKDALRLSVFLFACISTSTRYNMVFGKK